MTIRLAEAKDIESALDELSDIRARVQALEDELSLPPIVPPVVEPPIEPPTQPPVEPPIDPTQPPLPIDVSVVSNPNPENHPYFTAALLDADLHWADSLRPTGTPNEIDRYYGARRINTTLSRNHLVSYDAEMEAAKQLFLEGDKGIPQANQTRIIWPGLGPENSDACTVEWEFRESVGASLGGKAYQIATEGGELHFEYQQTKVLGQYRVPGWGRAARARVYRTEAIGGRGLSDMLVGGSSDPNSPDYCSGIFTCPMEPAKTWGSKTIPDWSVHPDRFYATTHDKWYRVTVSFDWRDPDNHKVWMWLQAEDDQQRHLIIGTPDQDGYPVTYKVGRESVNEFWIEFNNSKSINQYDSHCWIRNILVWKGMK